MSIWFGPMVPSSSGSADARVDKGSGVQDRAGTSSPKTTGYFNFEDLNALLSSTCS